MMQKYARIDNGIVAEIIEIADGTPAIQDRYHYSVVEKSVPLNGADLFAVKIGWKYDGVSFSQTTAPVAPPAPRYIPVWLARQRLEEMGLWDEVSAIIFANPAMALKVLTLESGLDVNDPQVLQVLAAVGADPAVVLG